MAKKKKRRWDPTRIRTWVFWIVVRFWSVALNGWYQTNLQIQQSNDSDCHLSLNRTTANQPTMHSRKPRSCPVTNTPAGDIKVISLAAELFKNGVKQPQHFIELIKGSRYPIIPVIKLRLSADQIWIMITNKFANTFTNKNHYRWTAKRANESFTHLLTTHP